MAALSQDVTRLDRFQVARRILIVGRAIHSSFARPRLKTPLGISQDHAEFRLRKRGQFRSKLSFALVAPPPLCRYLLGGSHLDRRNGLTLRSLDAPFKSLVIEARELLPTGGLRLRDAEWSGPQGAHSKPSANLPEVSQTAAAAMLNVSERTVRGAVKVKDEGAPALVAAVEAGKIPVSVAASLADKDTSIQAAAVAAPEKAAHIAKQVARNVRERAAAARILALPNKKYGAILADPEWRFEPWSRETGMDRAADNHYGTSVTGVIKARDVQSIAADNSVLAIWATVPMLPQALEVMAAWGFTYKSHFVWVKDRIGTGYWNRNKHELLLIGTRGDVPAPAPGTQWPSVIEGPVARHSKKPAIFYEIIESYFPSLPKIELNARRARRGWDAWGLEAPAGKDVA